VRDTTLSIHCGLIPVLLATVASCGGTVNEQAAASGAGGSSGTSPPVATSGSSGAGASTGTGTGAGGDDTVLGEPLCQLDEGALVMATSAASARIATQYEGRWATDGAVLPPAARVATYVDVYHQMAAFWIDPPGDGSSAHFVTTFDGSAFEARDVTGWAPLPSAPVLSPGGPFLVGAVEAGTNVAFFDPDASDWHPFVGPISFAASSAAAAAPALGTLTLVGLGDDHELCDVSVVGGTWQSVRCTPELVVATGGEIPLTRPQVVALPDGVLVAIHYSSNNTLAATTLFEGVWTSAVGVTSEAIGVSFAAAATPKGDVIVGVVSTSGDVSALRYSSGTGWSAPISVEGGALAQQQLAAAPGVCGDDALLAYLAEAGQVRVARVRGGAAGALSVADFADEQPDQVSIVTRPLDTAE